MRFEITVSTLYTVILAKTFGKKIDLASQDGGQVANKKLFSCHEFDLRKGNMAQKLFQSKGEKDIK